MPILMNVCGEELEVHNKVGAALIEQFQERFPDDSGYVVGKALDIKDLDMSACLLKWFALDHEGRRVFADKLGMPFDMLMSTAEGIKWIINN